MFFGLGAIGIVSAVVILFGAITVHSMSANLPLWGSLIFVSSLVSLLATGGLVIGAALGMIGGTLAMTRRPCGHRLVSL